MKTKKFLTRQVEIKLLSGEVLLKCESMFVRDFDTINSLIHPKGDIKNSMDHKHMVLAPGEYKLILGKFRKITIEDD